MRDSILLIIVRGWGSAAEELSLYPNVFKRLLEVADLPINIRVHNVTEDSEIMLLASDKAVVIGGSPHCLDEDLPWMRSLKKFIQKTAETKTKLLGICFGHQIISEALGGKVSQCQNGGELGIVGIELTEAGKLEPLFEELPGNFLSIAGHRDVVVKPPEGARILAKNQSNEYQALAIGDNIRTIQFHPEMTTDYLRGVIKRHKKLLTEMRLIKDNSGYQELIKSFNEKNSTYIGMKILMNFINNL